MTPSLHCRFNYEFCNPSTNFKTRFGDVSTSLLVSSVREVLRIICIDASVFSKPVLIAIQEESGELQLPKVNVIVLATMSACAYEDGSVVKSSEHRNLQIN